MTAWFIHSFSFLRYLLISLLLYLFILFIYIIHWFPFFLFFQFDLVCDQGSFGFISTSFMFAGHFIGSIAVSPISDKFGRKIPLFVGGFFCCLFNFVSAFSPAFWVFALFRAFIGFAIGKSEILSWIIYNIPKTGVNFPLFYSEAYKGRTLTAFIVVESLGTPMKMNWRMSFWNDSFSIGG